MKEFETELAALLHNSSDSDSESEHNIGDTYQNDDRPLPTLDNDYM